MHDSEELLTWELPSSALRQLKTRTYVTFSTAKSQEHYLGCMFWPSWTTQAPNRPGLCLRMGALRLGHKVLFASWKRSVKLFSFAWTPGACLWPGFQDFWSLLLNLQFRESVQNESKAFPFQSELGVHHPVCMYIYIGRGFPYRSPCYTYQHWIPVVI